MNITPSELLNQDGIKPWSSLLHRFLICVHGWLLPYIKFFLLLEKVYLKVFVCVCGGGGLKDDHYDHHAVFQTLHKYIKSLAMHTCFFVVLPYDVKSNNPKNKGKEKNSETNTEQVL